MRDDIDCGVTDLLRKAGTLPPDWTATVSVCGRTVTLTIPDPPGATEENVVTGLEAARRLALASRMLLVCCKAMLARHEYAYSLRKGLTGIAGGQLADEIAAAKAAIAVAEPTTPTERRS